MATIGAAASEGVVSTQIREVSAGCWKPWAALFGEPPTATRAGLKSTYFLGSRYSIGDAREIFQGNGHQNQLVALAINADVAERIQRAVNAHDDVVGALRTAIDHIEHMARFITCNTTGYSFESIGEDMPGLRSAIEKATGTASRTEDALRSAQRE